MGRWAWGKVRGGVGRRYRHNRIGTRVVRQRQAGQVRRYGWVGSKVVAKARACVCNAMRAARGTGVRAWVERRRTE